MSLLVKSRYRLEEACGSKFYNVASCLTASVNPHLSNRAGRSGYPPYLMTSPANIPQEIVDEIIQRPENDPNTLCNLCLVARSFLPRAQQILYRDITINLHSYDVPALSKWAVTAERAIEFFETLTTRNNALAEHVQRLYHHHYIRFSAYYWGLMKRSLRLMVNLQSLVLTSIPEPIIGFFNGCTFRLKNFDCDTLYNDFQTCREITQFFFSQPDIQSLDICGYTRPDEPFSGPHLPKLETLRGDSCSIENLLPQQPLVTNLSWALSFGERTIRLPTPRIASSLSNIHHFSLAGFSDRPDIGFLIPYLPSVRVLRLVGESSKVGSF